MTLSKKIYKYLYIFFLVLIIVINEFSTNFAKAKTFVINDIEIQEKYDLNFNKIKVVDKAFKKADLIIDFTVPDCTMEILKIASQLKKRVVIGTTGFNRNQENQIKKYSKKIPILKAGNMSLGVNLLMYLTEVASKSLNEQYLSKIFEVHHKHKKDYPSGTALMLGKGIADGKNKNLYLDKPYNI